MSHTLYIVSAVLGGGRGGQPEDGRGAGRLPGAAGSTPGTLVLVEGRERTEAHSGASGWARLHC